MFKKIWHDPVWSKVIASIIIALGAVGITFWNDVFAFFKNTINPKNEINILPSQKITLPSEPKRANSKSSPPKDITRAVDVKQADLNKQSSAAMESNFGIASNRNLPKETPLPKEEIAKSSISSSIATDNKEAVALAISTLSGQVGSNRLQSTAALLGALPNNLTAKEIALLLENSIGSTRNEILKLLITKIKTKSLNPENISDILGQEVGQIGLTALKLLHHTLNYQLMEHKLQVFLALKLPHPELIY